MLKNSRISSVRNSVFGKRSCIALYYFLRIVTVRFRRLRTQATTVDRVTARYCLKRGGQLERVPYLWRLKNEL